MAVRSHSEVGKIRGKIGNTITRYRNKKYVVYSAPSEINYSHSKAAVSARNKFTTAVRLAKMLNSNPELKEIWKFSSLKGTNAYQKIIKHNSLFLTSSGLTKFNFITPAGLGLYNPSLQFDSDELVFSSELMKADGLTPKTFFTLFSSQNSDAENLFLVTSEDISLKNCIITGKLQLPNYIRTILENSGPILLFFAFSFSTNQPKAIYYTATSSFEILQNDSSPICPGQDIKTV